ncbi:hypothetical protein B0H14DRAFT_2760703 [Mycena olivaceomarginata]|nr:hypothetical protein B0H14DRAFT_2760703 [Mycena olivaceomarginata]
MRDRHDRPTSAPPHDTVAHRAREISHSVQPRLPLCPLRQMEGAMMLIRTMHVQAGRTYGHNPDPDPALTATRKCTSRAPPPDTLTSLTRAPHPILPVYPGTTNIRCASRSLERRWLVRPLAAPGPCHRCARCGLCGDTTCALARELDKPNAPA